MSVETWNMLRCNDFIERREKQCPNVFNPGFSNATKSELRKAAKLEGWTWIHGSDRDYCGDCLEAQTVRGIGLWVPCEGHVETGAFKTCPRCVAATLTEAVTLIEQLREEE